MKTIAAFLCFAFAPVVVQAQVSPAAKPEEPKAAVGKEADKAKPPAKKEEPMGVIVGTTLSRPNGEFLGLTLLDGKYKLTFYNKKKKPVKVDVTRAVARWPNPHGPGNNQTVLNPAGDGTFLLGAQFVRGPHAFVLTIVLLQGEGDEAKGVENYTVQFRG